VKYLALFLIIISFNSFAQTEAEHKAMFRQAFEEQKAMLEGKKPLDFKRAVWVTENAFHKNKLDYQQFCSQIAEIGKKLKSMIKQRGFEKYPTAGNWAAFSYMSDSIPQNNFKPYVYDFDDFWGRKDGSKHFVTKLLNTKQGNCSSLPKLYKLLCAEIGYPSFLVPAPSHLYIKHKDDNGKWTNLELTSKGFPRDEWLVKSLGVSLASIKTGAYMTHLKGKEEIAYCIINLGNAYNFYFGYDDFCLEMDNTGLKYYPQSIELRMGKSNTLLTLYRNEKAKGFPDKDLSTNIWSKYKIANIEIDSLGYQEMPKDAYETWLASVEKARLERKQIESKTKIK
jgi:hypothetical protein